MDAKKYKEWKRMAEIIFSEPIECQCCKVSKATDLHCMVERNNVVISDYLPVCKGCRKVLIKAVKDGYIPRKVSDLERIRDISQGILSDQKYKQYVEYLNSKRTLPDDLVKSISESDYITLNRISSIIGRRIKFSELDSIIITGKKIIEIRRIINSLNGRKKSLTS